MSKVIVNSIPLRGPMNGIGRYIKSLFNELIKEKHLDIEFFYGTYFSKKLENDAVINKNILGLAKRMPFYYFLRELYISNAIKLKTNKNNYLYHNPNFISYKLNCPIITNIHDISFIKFPEFHPKKRVDFLTKHIRRSIDISDIILTDSNYIRDEIVDYFKINSDRVYSIPLGVSSNFKPKSDTDCKNILMENGLIYKKYFLSVSTIEPRKNIISSIKAYISLPEKIQKEYPLVIVGMDGWLNSELYDHVKKLLEKKRIIFLGHISEVKLPILYGGAKLLIYPSLYEGFGLPIIEAYATGLPVISSNTSSMLEIGQNAAVIIDPLNIEQIHDSILKIINDIDYEKKLIIAGLKKSKKYTWQSTAKKTLEIYNKLL